MKSENDIILKINNLTASINEIPILKKMNLTIKKGEIHAIMGPNGSGKSTFSKVIAGHPAYNVTGGEILFKGDNIISLGIEERALKGIFLAFQYPVEIPGVSNADFLRLAFNTNRKFQGLEEMDPLAFFEFINQKLSIVGLDPSFLSRNVNEGFSGGEKKRNEVLQMAILNASLCILDETDSGLDVDALRLISNSINNIINKDTALIVITHYQRLLDYIRPDFVHIMIDGKIVLTGNAELAKQIELYGYDWDKLKITTPF
uniref:iron-sulfur cluster formation ABC transporter ATP-binding subunit n=1 Tax=Glaucosphaera vacuolata TaxID=38265 RepID=UPI001FCCC904|nr:iron-sulfur cluster formation ABC transporter ATP-binding subunit [Glaucosphaera vacuolata]UNJ18758.1 iron-sulfur cluster formation ABC transporter ATP-binding subunit [Glaucosphaera vacuolata]